MPKKEVVDLKLGQLKNPKAKHKEKKKEKTKNRAPKSKGTNTKWSSKLNGLAYV